MLKLKSAAVIFLITLILLSPAVCEEQEFINENPLTDEMVRDNVIQKGYSIRPNALEDVKKTEDVIATSGIMPNLAAGADSYNWWITIRNITDDITEDGALNEYLGKNGGFVGGYGPFADGTIRIIVSEKSRENLTTTSDFEEIVAVFEEYARKENVSSPPLVFLIAEEYYPLVDDEEIIPQKEMNKSRYSMLFAGILFVLILVLFLSLVMKKERRK